MFGKHPASNLHGRTETPVSEDEVCGYIEKILSSTAFQGSETSRQLLRYLAKTHAADPERHPKEHEIATVVLGRGVEFDPRVDSVVRMQMGRLRSKLAEYYLSEGSEAEVILQIPKGEYHLCYLRRDTSRQAGAKPALKNPTVGDRRTWWYLGLLGIALVVAAFIIGALLFRGSTAKNQSALRILPWSVLLRGDRQLHLVVSDPDIAALQALFSYQISLSDYANKRYFPKSLPSHAWMPDPIRFFRGVNVSSVAMIASMNIAELTIPFSKPLRIDLPRTLQLRDIKTDDDFIFIGSPRSNPWTDLFADQLDFYFMREDPAATEVVVNRRPQSAELSRYVPSAAGWETGQGFAILAFIGNTGQRGHAFLLAGTNAEGTEAAAKLALNLDLLASTLTKHGIDPRGPLCHFEVLLKVRTMAGSPSETQVITCHRLPN